MAVGTGSKCLGENELSFGENGLSFVKRLSSFGPEFFAKWTKKKPYIYVDYYVLLLLIHNPGRDNQVAVVQT